MESRAVGYDQLDIPYILYSHTVGKRAKKKTQNKKHHFEVQQCDKESPTVPDVVNGLGNQGFVLGERLGSTL